MWKLNLILCFVVLAVLPDVESVTCKYVEYSVSGNKYTCFLMNQVILSEAEMTEITGIHLDQKTNLDVSVLSSFNSSISIFPSVLIDQFPNLQEAYFQYSNVSSFNSRIQNCANLDLININNNLLNSLPAGIFQNCAKLYRLNVQSNLITEIDENAFNGLGNLGYLDLSHNNLDNFNAMSFAPLGNLLGLDLSNNRIVNLNEAMFPFMPLLMELNLLNNVIADNNLATILWSNTDLRTLELGGNRIRFVHGMLFNRQLRLEHLSIGSNITMASTFDELRFLKTFDMSNNQMTSAQIQIISNMSRLETFDASNNRIFIIDFKKISTMHPTQLTTLLLKNNEIAEIGANSFEALDLLQHLDLSGNKLTRINTNYMQPIILRLRVFDVADNQLTRVQRSIFANVTSLELRMRGNICYNETILINNDFETRAVPLLKECFNSAVSTFGSVLTLLASVTVSFLLKM